MLFKPLKSKDFLNVGGGYEAKEMCAMRGFN